MPTEGRSGDRVDRCVLDPDIRPVLAAALRTRHRRQAGTVIVEELGLLRGQVRIDVAVVNGSLHGYEIKSGRDSLRRFQAQVAGYGSVLDYATAVIAACHLAKVLEAVPSWWEILVVDECGPAATLRLVRKGRRNPGVQPRALVELLWADDAKRLLDARGVLRGLRNAPRARLWDRVCEVYSGKEIAAAVRGSLKTRADQRSPRRPE